MSRARRDAVCIVAAEGRTPRVQALLDGLEEEGVPVEVALAAEVGGAPTDADDLAAVAAARAAFEIGVGVDDHGAIRLRHAALPVDHLPRLSADVAVGRVRELGQDAGRLVRRLPLRGASHAGHPIPSHSAAGSLGSGSDAGSPGRSADDSKEQQP